MPCLAGPSLAAPKIKPVWDSVVTDVLDVKQDKVTGVQVKNLKTGAETTLDCAGVFVAIGHPFNRTGKVQEARQRPR